jgi:hypothetical protein
MFPREDARRGDRRYAVSIAAVVGVGLWLFWPTLDAGLFSDDYFTVASMDGRLAARRAEWDLFNFGNGTSEDVHALRRLGSIAWWSSADFRISFLRPLSSALFHVDRWLFGRDDVAYHAHSLAAWAAAVIAVAWLYRRLVSGGVAVLAVAMFALDQSQHGPVVWLCNRGALYAILVGALALRAHLSWRLDGRRGARWVSAALLAIGVLFGEWALPMFAYVVAFEAFGTRDAWRARVAALVPAGVVALAFLAVRGALHYGARGSGVYVDPMADPATFVRLLLHRVPVLVADMVFDVPASWWDFGSPWRTFILHQEWISPSLWSRLPGWQPLHLLLGIGAIAAMALLLAWSAQGFDEEERRHVRWLAPGALLALFPVVGAFASTRLTLTAFVGFAPLMALCLREIGRRVLAFRRIGKVRAFAFALLGLVLLRVQLVDALREDMARTADDFRAASAWVRRAELDPNVVAGQHVFLLSAVEFTTTFFFAYTWGYFHPLPRSFVPLTVAPWPLEIERPAPDVLIVRTLGGTFMDSAAELHYRPRASPLRPGDVVRVGEVRAEVADTLGAEPSAMRFRFDRPVEDAAYVFLAATPRGLRRAALPDVGGTVRLPRAGRPNWIEAERGRYVERIGPIPELLNFAPTPYFVRFDPR